MTAAAVLIRAVVGWTLGRWWGGLDVPSSSVGGVLSVEDITAHALISAVPLVLLAVAVLT
jgi:hypothetical protein